MLPDENVRDFFVEKLEVGDILMPAYIVHRLSLYIVVTVSPSVFCNDDINFWTREDRPENMAARTDRGPASGPLLIGSSHRTGDAQRA